MTKTATLDPFVKAYQWAQVTKTEQEDSLLDVPSMAVALGVATLGYFAAISSLPKEEKDPKKKDEKKPKQEVKTERK